MKNRMQPEAAQARRIDLEKTHAERDIPIPEPLHAAETLKALIETAGDAIVSMDASGRIALWNRAAEKIFGYSALETMGNPLTLIMPERLRDGHDRSVREYLATGKPNIIGKPVEIAGLTKDGREIPVELTLANWATAEGIFFTGIIRDLSDRKAFEEKLKKAKDEADELNTQLEEALATANKMAAQAEMANIAKSQFLANMSHEIRTPMNGVIGMTGILLDTDLTAEQREYAGIVLKSSESLLAVINDILDYSKIEANKLDLETIDFDLRATVEDAVETLAINAQKKGLGLFCLIPHTVPSLVRGDPGRLRQILVNLSGNAIKFTDKGEVVVRVEMEKEEDSRVSLRFSVSDTGIGIPQDRIDSLFQSFSQLDASTTRKYGGTGLGLSISKKLCEMMGGRIGVESEAAKGSTFWFTVSLEKQPFSEKSEQHPPKDIRGKRVLVVDDNATNRQVLKEQLASWSCDAQAASDATEALKKLQEAHDQGAPFHLAILDMHMPEMDGETLGKKIKESDALKGTILVMLTSLGRRGDARRAEEIGFAAYLTKPVKHTCLYDCLATVSGMGAEKDNRGQSIVTRHSLAEERKRRSRVLLADDDATNRKVGLSLLHKLGYHADAVVSGKEAIGALHKMSYDIILMDVHMPEMDGIEATHAIRDPSSDVPDHHIPIIAMTAHAMGEHRRRCLAAGMNDFLSKPIMPEALANAIERQLSGPTRMEQPKVVSGPCMNNRSFDRAVLLERLSGDEALVSEVIEVYMNDVPGQLAELRQCLQNRDADGIRMKGHRIKGASANIQAQRMRDIAFEIETAGKNGSVDEACVLLERLEQEFVSLKKDICNSAPDF